MEDPPQPKEKQQQTSKTRHTPQNNRKMQEQVSIVLTLHQTYPDVII